MLSIKFSQLAIIIFLQFSINLNSADKRFDERVAPQGEDKKDKQSIKNTYAIKKKNGREIIKILKNYLENKNKGFQADKEKLKKDALSKVQTILNDKEIYFTQVQEFCKENDLKEFADLINQYDITYDADLKTHSTVCPICPTKNDLGAGNLRWHMTKHHAKEMQEFFEALKKKRKDKILIGKARSELKSKNLLRIINLIKQCAKKENSESNVLKEIKELIEEGTNFTYHNQLLSDYARSKDQHKIAELIAANEPLIVDGKYKCKICGGLFESLSGLGSHVKFLHELKKEDEKENSRAEKNLKFQNIRKIVSLIGKCSKGQVSKEDTFAEIKELIEEGTNYIYKGKKLSNYAKSKDQQKIAELIAKNEPIVNNQGGFLCSKCDKVYETTQGLSSHIRNNHPNSNEDKVPFKEKEKSEKSDKEEKSEEIEDSKEKENSSDEIDNELLTKSQNTLKIVNLINESSEKKISEEDALVEIKKIKEEGAGKTYKNQTLLSYAKSKNQMRIANFLAGKRSYLFTENGSFQCIKCNKIFVFDTPKNLLANHSRLCKRKQIRPIIKEKSDKEEKETSEKIEEEKVNTNAETVTVNKLKRDRLSVQGLLSESVRKIKRLKPEGFSTEDESESSNSSPAESELKRSVGLSEDKKVSIGDSINGSSSLSDLDYLALVATASLNEYSDGDEKSADEADLISSTELTEKKEQKEDKKATEDKQKKEKELQEIKALTKALIALIKKQDIDEIKKFILRHEKIKDKIINEYCDEGFAPIIHACLNEEIFNLLKENGADLSKKGTIEFAKYLISNGGVQINPDNIYNFHVLWQNSDNPMRGIHGNTCGIHAIKNALLAGLQVKAARCNNQSDYYRLQQGLIAKTGDLHLTDLNQLSPESQIIFTNINRLLTQYREKQDRQNVALDENTTPIEEINYLISKTGEILKSSEIADAISNKDITALAHTDSADISLNFDDLIKLAFQKAFAKKDKNYCHSFILAVKTDSRLANPNHWISVIVFNNKFNNLVFAQMDSLGKEDYPEVEQLKLAFENSDDLFENALKLFDLYKNNNITDKLSKINADDLEYWLPSLRIREFNNFIQSFINTFIDAVKLGNLSGLIERKDFNFDGIIDELKSNLRELFTKFGCKENIKVIDDIFKSKNIDEFVHRFNSLKKIDPLREKLKKELEQLDNVKIVSEIYDNKLNTDIILDNIDRAINKDSNENLLMLAIKKGKFELVKTILDCGANPYLETRNNSQTKELRYAELLPFDIACVVAGDNKIDNLKMLLRYAISYLEKEIHFKKMKNIKNVEDIFAERKTEEKEEVRDIEVIFKLAAQKGNYKLLRMLLAFDKSLGVLCNSELIPVDSTERDKIIKLFAEEKSKADAAKKLKRRMPNRNPSFGWSSQAFTSSSIFSSSSSSTSSSPLTSAQKSTDSCSSTSPSTGIQKSIGYSSITTSPLPTSASKVLNLPTLTAIDANANADYSSITTSPLPTSANKALNLPTLTVIDVKANAAAMDTNPYENISKGSCTISSTTTTSVLPPKSSSPELKIHAIATLTAIRNVDPESKAEEKIEEPRMPGMSDDELNKALLDECRKAKDDMSVVGKLLELGAQINARDHQKNTPLIIAAKNKNWTLIQFLIQRNAEIFLHNDERKIFVDYLPNYEEQCKRYESLPLIDKCVLRSTISDKTTIIRYCTPKIEHQWFYKCECTALLKYSNRNKHLKTHDLSIRRTKNYALCNKCEIPTYYNRNIPHKCTPINPLIQEDVSLLPKNNSYAKKAGKGKNKPMPASIEYIPAGVGKGKAEIPCIPG